MKQATQEEAILLSQKFDWMTYQDKNQIAAFQLSQDRLCMDFSIFHGSIEKALNRPVFTHEFAFNRRGLEEKVRFIELKSLLEEIKQRTGIDLINEAEQKLLND